MISVFLSHNSEDKPFVRIIYNRLLQLGIKVWMDEAELRVGDSLLQLISEAAVNVDYLIVILSKSSIQSRWVLLEVEIVYNKFLKVGYPKVLPVLKEKIEIPDKLKFLSPFLYCDLSNPLTYESEFSKLLRSIGLSTGINATLYNLGLFKFLDLVKTENEIFILGTQMTGRGNYFKDPEGTEVFESYLYIIQISRNGTVNSKIISSNIAVSIGALKISKNVISIFYTYKTADLFNMHGALTLVEKDTLHTYNTRQVFSDKNWGWFPTILDDNKVQHFSYSNYHKCIDNNKVDDETFDVNAFIESYKKERHIHSDGLLYMETQQMIEEIQAWVDKS